MTARADRPSSEPQKQPAQAGGLSPTEREVLALFDADDVVSLASALIAAPSENPGGAEAETVSVLARACRDAGLTVETAEVAAGRENLTATLPGGDGDGVMFLGHSDVVPAGPGWSRDPFESTVENGRLYGRGSTDMKGGLAAVVVALAALRRSGLELAGPARLVCAVDEEEHGAGIRAFTRAAASDPQRYRACVVAEPTDLDTVVGCRGDSYLQVTVTGRPAHAGRPTDGRNAIDAAARVLAIIAEDARLLAADPDPLLGHGTWNTGLISGGSGTAVVAPNCRISLDRRLMPGEDPTRIADELSRKIRDEGIDTDGIDVRVEAIMEMPGFRLPPDHALPTLAVAALADATGPDTAGPDAPATDTPDPDTAPITSEIGGWSAACDGGFISRDLGVDTIVCGPGGINDQAHQVDESVGVDELIAAARAYALICIRMLPMAESVAQRTPTNQ